jgi:coenzyme Q-binding protein COQ10
MPFMPAYRETMLVPYSREQLFDLVADVEKYPQFLPWCRAARIHERGEGYMVAELVIAFKGIRESYTSRVDLRRPEAIDVTMVKGPFHHLVNHWRFSEAEDGQTRIEFDLDFRFSSRWLETLIGALFSRATEKMVTAFRGRADQLYGPPSDANV